MNRINIHRLSGWLEFTGDIFSISAAYLITSAVFGIYSVLENIPLYISALCTSCIILYMLDAYGGVDSFSAKKRMIPSILMIAQLLSAAAVFVILLLFNAKFVGFPFWVIFYALGYLLLLLCRSLILKMLIKIRKQRSLLILFPEDCPEKFLNKLKRNSDDFGSVAVYKIPSGETYVSSEAARLISTADELLIASNISEDLRDKFILYALQRGSVGAAPHIKIISTVENLSFLGGRVSYVGDTPVIRIKNGQLSFLERFIKRAFDFTASLIGLTVLSPVFLVCAAAIKINSPGPVFYFQERYTMHRKKFNIIKFRTMVQDAEKLGARLATEQDERITSVGRFLRACRLDELPQLINILKGDMSIVGPRPERPIYADEYSKIVKNFDIRYLVNAGLTGYAQVYGRYNTKVSDKILLDSIYINNFSLWLDLKLIVLTLVIMFTKDAAAGVDEDMASAPSAEEQRVG